MKKTMIMFCAAMLCVCGVDHKEKNFSQEENADYVRGESLKRDIIDSIIATDWMHRYVDFSRVGCILEEALKRR